MKRALAVILALSLATGCVSEDDPLEDASTSDGDVSVDMSAEDTSASTGLSCELTNRTCLEFTGLSVEEAASFCANQFDPPGTFNSETRCSTVDSVGLCSSDSDNDRVFVLVYYSPDFDPTTAENDCTTVWEGNFTAD